MNECQKCIFQLVLILDWRIKARTSRTMRNKWMLKIIMRWNYAYYHLGSKNSDTNEYLNPSLMRNKAWYRQNSCWFQILFFLVCFEMIKILVIKEKEISKYDDKLIPVFMTLTSCYLDVTRVLMSIQED